VRDQGGASAPVFRILGPVGVGALDTLGSRQQRALLAILLLHGNRIVPNERLIRVLHGEDPPPSAGHGLHVRVSQLRRTLATAVPEPEDRLVLSPPGYRLRVLPGELDWDVFRTFADRGRQSLAAGDIAEARELLAAALALWHGGALADVTAPALDDQRGHLEQRRLAALEDPRHRR
jgi:DNA-binding SARP family transcriptional activator